MAKVIITIEDDGDGHGELKLNTAIEFDPPGLEGEVPTEAQKIGSFLYETVLPDLLAPDEETPSAQPNPKPLAENG